MLINLDLEMIERLEKEIEDKDAYEARNIVHQILKENGFIQVHQYEFKKTGVLDRMVDRSIYCDNYNLVIVDFGQEYEEMDGSYYPFYFLGIKIIDDESFIIYKEF